jgi:hypothetical protein
LQSSSSATFVTLKLSEGVSKRGRCLAGNSACEKLVAGKHALGQAALPFIRVLSMWCVSVVFCVCVRERERVCDCGDTERLCAFVPAYMCAHACVCCMCAQHLLYAVLASYTCRIALLVCVCIYIYIYIYIYSFAHHLCV